MDFIFSIDSEGVNFLKNNKDYLFPNIKCDEGNSTVTLDTESLRMKCTPGQFMSEVKQLGLLVGRRGGSMVVLDSERITKYPRKLEAF